MQPARKTGYIIDIVLMILTVVTLNIIPHQINVLMKYAILAYLFCKYVWYLTGHKTVFTLLAAYAVVLAFSSLFNTVSISWTVAAFMAGFQLIVLFITTAALCQQIGKMVFVNYLIKLFIILLLCNDCLFFIMPYDFSNADESYLVGNKFLVSYYHCFVCCLIYMKSGENAKKWRSAALFVLCGAVSLRVSCSTGVIMAGILLVMMFLPEKLRKFFRKPATLFGTIAVENILIWGTANIFTHPFVQKIIVDVFHKSPNMSGRFKLYEVTGTLVKDKPLLGYGHNTDIYRTLLGYGNAQNGLFHIVIQAGILGAVLYFGAVYLGLRNKSKEETPYALYMYLFAMAVVSAIEINLSLQFMLGVAIVYGFNADHWKKQIV